MTSKELINELKAYFEDLGFKVLNEYSKAMPIQLKRWDDVDCCWIEIPIECEGIDEKKSKYTYMKYNFEYRCFGGKNTLCYNYNYNTGGGSGNYTYNNIEDFIKASLRCHHIIEDITKYKKTPEIEQMSIFDFI